MESGLQKAFDSLNIAINLIGDGFRAVGVVTNLFAGTLYRLASVWYEVKATFTWGDVKKDAIANITAMQNKSDEYFTKGFDGIKNYESQTIKSIENMGKTEDQKNIERVANNEKTLTDLKAQEAKHVSDYKAISDERIKLNQQLVDARKSGDQSAIDAAVAGLAELDKKEKAYQAESKKISDEKIKAAQDWATAQVDAATKGGVALSSQTKKTIEAQIAAQGLAVEFDKTGKAIVKAIEQEAGAAVVSLETRLGQGRKAAAALGLDLDVALNRVSEGFAAKQTNLDDFTKSLELMGVKGQDAANVTYEAWLKWLETAKSQAEIDLAKKKFDEFQEKGVFSTKQVEMGMLAIRQQTQKLPDDLDETGKAFERLGIKTKEQLKLAADVAIADFNRIQASGQATTEGLKQAYERVLQAAVASGDQSAIAATKAKAASLGLQVQVDETGKASVKSMNELSNSVENVGRTASGSAADGFRDLGKTAREEAQSTADEWEQAMAKVAAQRKAQAAETSKGLGQAMNDMNAKAKDFENRLAAAGMDAGQAKKKGQEALDSMLFAYSQVLKMGNVTDFSTPLLKKMEDTLSYWEGKKSGSSGSSISVGGNANAPKTPSTPNIQAPNININTPNVPSSNPKTVTYKIEFGGKSLELAGDPSQQNLMNDFLSELEQLNRAR